MASRFFCLYNLYTELPSWPGELLALSGPGQAENGLMDFGLDSDTLYIFLFRYRYIKDYTYNVLYIYIYIYTYTYTQYIFFAESAVFVT